jgi:hypothetical protein
MAKQSKTAARISHDAAAERISAESAITPDVVSRISHDAAAHAPADVDARISHDAAAKSAVVLPLPLESAAAVATDTAARISHDAAATKVEDATARISHDAAVTSSGIAEAPAGAVPATSDVNATAGESPFRMLCARAKASVSQLIRNPSVRRGLVLAKTLGITGVLLGGIQQVTAAHAPQWADPVAEHLFLRRNMAAFTNEPGDQAPGQGKLSTTSKFKYEFRISDLDGSGVVRGRFRGFSADGQVDPRWWYVSGRSDGKRAMLTYRNEKGDVLGELNLLRSKDGSVWAGHLLGIDRSISDADLVQSPIIVAQSDYDLTRHKSDEFLNESPVLVKGYTR